MPLLHAVVDVHRPKEAVEGAEHRGTCLDMFPWSNAFQMSKNISTLKHHTHGFAAVHESNNFKGLSFVSIGLQ